MSDVLETTGLKAGQLVFPDNNNIVRRGVKASTTIVAGDPITFDTNGFMLKASDSVGTQSEGLGVARESGVNSGGDGAISLQAVLAPTFVGFTMGGAVPPFKKVKLNATFKAVANSSPANSALNAVFSDVEVETALDLVRDYVNKNFGRYYGHHKEEKEPTVSADTEIGVIRLGAD